MANYISLSKELQYRINEDRHNNIKNPYAYKNEDVIRRYPDHDRANLWRPAYVRDIEKIMHIPYYNRYSDKTQVYSLYKNDDISRRAQHVQLVSRIARNIGTVLGLNIDLIEAISLGHDIGHTPFGHAGERKLDEIYFARTGRHFNHNIQSARVLDKIFPLNLSMQTLDGIISHNGEIELCRYAPVRYDDFKVYDEKVKRCYLDSNENKRLMPSTLEGCVMRVADIIAYLGKDRQDAIRLGLLDESQCVSDSAIGSTNAEIINNMIVNIIENSYGEDYIKVDKEYFDAFAACKRENYKLIYGSPHAIDEQIYPMIEQIYHRLISDITKNNKSSVIYSHHIEYINENTKYYRRCDTEYSENNPDDIVVDYIASMTDDYFVDLYNYLFPNGRYSVRYKGYFEDV